MNTSGTYKERQLGTKADRLAQLMKTRGMRHLSTFATPLLSGAHGMESYIIS